MSVADNPVFEWQQARSAEFANAADEAALFAALVRAAASLGFEYCAYGMRLPLPFSNPKTVMLNNYPAAWQERYARENYLMRDPTVALGAASLQPMVWSEQLFASCRPLWEDARAQHLNIGWAQSSRDASGKAGLLTLARSCSPLSAAELRHNQVNMSWLAHAAHEAMVRLHTGSAAAQLHGVLTPREIEVLQWMADGKTSGEAATILTLSERTVNFHVSNAMTKLGAVNKTSAVVKAAMLGLL